MGESSADFARMLRDALAQAEPLPDALVHRAATDPGFLHYLIAVRRHREEVRALVESSQRRGHEHRTPASSLLVLRAARSLARWAAAGFGVSDPETFERRRAACLSCPRARAAGPAVVYALVGDGNEMVCGACGCAIHRKARLPTESCPEPHPAVPGVTRWGEPSE